MMAFFVSIMCPPEPRTPPRGLVYALRCSIVFSSMSRSTSSLGLALRRLLCHSSRRRRRVTSLFVTLLIIHILSRSPYLRLRLRWTSSGSSTDRCTFGCSCRCGISILAKIDTRRNTSNSRSDPLGGLLPERFDSYEYPNCSFKSLRDGTSNGRTRKANPLNESSRQFSQEFTCFIRACRVGLWRSLEKVKTLD